jgi:hypothetical protein
VKNGPAFDYKILERARERARERERKINHQKGLGFMLA